MYNQGVIKPSSSLASPVILVPKRCGTTRACIDHRRLNAVTTEDIYPLHRIDDILDTLGKANSPDLASGYTTHLGLFELVRMPFGLCYDQPLSIG